MVLTLVHILLKLCIRLLTDSVRFCKPCGNGAHFAMKEISLYAQYPVLLHSKSLRSTLAIASATVRCSSLDLSASQCIDMQT